MNIEPIQNNPELEVFLSGNSLPVADLRATRGLQFFGVRTPKGLIGVVGIEVHGAKGLLRSLAVAETYRRSGCGRALVAHAESQASRQGVATLFLLTETAADFFLHLGYETIPRSEAPAEIVGTSQFACLCPASATLMRKVLKKESSVSVSH